MIRDVAGEQGQLRSIVVTVNYQNGTTTRTYADHLHFFVRIKDPMRKLSRIRRLHHHRDDASMAVVLVVLSGALTTFKNALAINDTSPPRS